MKKGIALVFTFAVLGMMSPVAWGSSNDSIDYVGVTPADPGGDDDMQLWLKVIGFGPTTQTGPIDLVGGDTAVMVSAKAANALCRAVFPDVTALGGTCSATVTGIPASVDCAAPLSDPATCCDDADLVPLGDKDATTHGLTVSCALRGRVFSLNRAVGGDLVSATTPPTGNIANFQCNSSLLTTIETDLASNVLVQIRPNGIQGTIHVQFTHGQGGQNPKDAAFTINAGNVNDPVAIHNGVAAAINALAFAPDVVANRRTLSTVSENLTRAPGEYGGQDFVEIETPPSVLVTKVRLIGVAGQTLVVESTEDIPDVPALGSWGLLLVVVMLCASGYWLLRRRMRATAA